MHGDDIKIVSQVWKKGSYRKFVVALFEVKRVHFGGLQKRKRKEKELRLNVLLILLYYLKYNFILKLRFWFYNLTHCCNFGLHPSFFS